MTYAVKVLSLKVIYIWSCFEITIYLYIKEAYLDNISKYGASLDRESLDRVL